MPDKPPPLPLAPNASALQNRLSLALSSRSSLFLKSLSSKSTLQTVRHTTGNDDDDLKPNALGDNQGLGYVGDKKEQVTREEDRVLRNKLLGKGGREQLEMGRKGREKKGFESESEDEEGRSGLGKGKGKRKRRVEEEDDVQEDPKRGVKVTEDEGQEDREEKVQTAPDDGAEDTLMEEAGTKQASPDNVESIPKPKRKRTKKRKNKTQTTNGQ